MRNHLNLAAASLLMLATAGCGGGGGGVASTPIPTPSPTPTPTPTPTPVAVGETPPELPPTLTGTLAQAYKGDQDFRTGSAEVSYAVDNGTLQTRNKAYQSSTSIRVYYDKAKDSYTVSNLDVGNAFDFSGEPASGDANFYSFGINQADGVRRLRILKPDNQQIALTYTSYGVWQFDSSDRADVTPRIDDSQYFYFGIPTADADVPRTGSGHYEGIADGLLFTADKTYDLSGTTTLDADFGGGSLTTALLLSGVDRNGSDTLALPGFAGNATIAAGNGFVGTLSTADNSYVGSIQGAFFGPHAEEFGYSWAINNPALTSLGGGVAVGKR